MQTKLESLRQARSTSAPQRGAAFVEGIVVVMFMIIIFAGIRYLGHYFVAKQKALMTARTCAWQYSQLSCDERNLGELSEECQRVVGAAGAVREEPDQEMTAATENVNPRGAVDDADTSSDSNADQVTEDEQANANRTANTEANMRSGMQSRLDGMLTLIVGKSVLATASSEVERPPMFVNAEDKVYATYYLPCNMRNRKALEMAKDLWSDMDMSLP